MKTLNNRDIGCAKWARPCWWRSVRHILAITLLTSFQVVACARPEMSETNASSRQALLGGTPDTATRAVVYIRVDSNTGVNACSGMVISPHVVLTATHCLDPRLTGANPSFSIFLGDTVDDSTPTKDPSKWLSVDAIKANDKFDPEVAGQDIGLLATREVIPIDPIPFSQEAMQKDQNGAAIRMIGFGKLSDDGGDSVATRRAVNSKLIGFTNERLILENLLCNGDSGGAVVISKGGKETIIGVNSFGTCGEPGYPSNATRVDAYAETFVVPFVEEHDPGFLSKTNDAGIADGAPGNIAAAPAESGCSVGHAAQSSPALLSTLLAVAGLWARRRRSRRLHS